MDLAFLSPGITPGTTEGSSRRAEGNLLEATSMMGELKVFTSSDGTISVTELKDFSGQLKKFREISPLVYRDINGQDMIAFKRDANGRLYFAMDWPFMTFQRVGWIQSKIFNYVVLGLSVSVLLLTLILWPVAALVRRHYHYRLTLSPREKRLRMAVRLVCALQLIFLVALVVLLSSLETPGSINSQLDPWIHLLQIIGWIGVLGSLVVVYNALYGWSIAPEVHENPSHSIWPKVFQTLIALACIGLSWFFIYWNLLNLSSNY